MLSVSHIEAAFHDSVRSSGGRHRSAALVDDAGAFGVARALVLAWHGGFHNVIELTSQESVHFLPF